MAPSPKNTTLMLDVPRACSAHARTGGQRQVAGDNSGRPEHAAPGIDEVHRAATAPAQPGLATDDFSEGGFDVAALGEHVPVAAMPGEQLVVRLEVRAHPDRNRFLTRRKVGESGTSPAAASRCTCNSNCRIRQKSAEQPGDRAERN